MRIWVALGEICFYVTWKRDQFSQARLVKTWRSCKRSQRQPNQPLERRGRERISTVWWPCRRAEHAVVVTGWSSSRIRWHTYGSSMAFDGERRFGRP
ncbi:MAG: hypothetical protein CMJ64_03565 [Planctomycetaceae bacterium]|nr:hypothetical protein [Planctomycetaceae bacterium]